MLVHTTTVHRIEPAYLLNGAAVVIQHHAALSGVSDVLIIAVQHCHVVYLARTSKIEKLISQVRLWRFDVREMPVISDWPGVIIPQEEMLTSCIHKRGQAGVLRGDNAQR
ncbi:Uncharacterised protein [Citrobacter werkmanii]|uniref:Uncharacterized protein n=1 Tax=Citrobacter werkmanii TaxID=67827 RepID=A0A9N8CLM7_9ENTR|nr:Uncharacterised protein [Citrobacter werkmanii]CAB5527603.1 Uncharacterised protein [Citrobacter werkmanii]CAB5532076.1 Uncharacterised protein [Citrobacter werkmanii]CAB5535349.1 Uncharacterised protein [Citrobacter werkmanii]CAB5545025.1 Uncharacterised protein [Citrobacter werkmanii]